MIDVEVKSEMYAAMCDCFYRKIVAAWMRDDAAQVSVINLKIQGLAEQCMDLGESESAVATPLSESKYKCAMVAEFARVFMLAAKEPRKFGDVRLAVSLARSETSRQRVCEALTELDKASHSEWLWCRATE